MSPRRELLAFAIVLGVLVGALLGESLVTGKVLSPADVLFVSASFREVGGPGYQPSNRLLMDPVLQFQPWIEFNRAMLRRGRLPLWNGHAGMGVPHLANAQSGVFDPFHLIAYLGAPPTSHAWMAAARLWVAGLGMFLLARAWGLGVWGRWFAGLCFPLSGFLVVWLLFPVTSVAVWMPWLFLAVERLFERASARRVSLLALTTGITVLGGHIQTTAQVLLAAGGYVAWRAIGDGLPRPSARSLRGWAVASALGLAVGAVTIVPLGVYLTKSPVWSDRARECPSPLTVTRPRLLDALCTAIPYAYGSQRRGHPNLARALGVHNVNESAGGFAGLATLLWLAPAAWGARAARPRVKFLVGLAALGFLGAFGFPPVANVLRALPVTSVMDQRRLTLWVAFALVLLGGMGLDRLPDLVPGWRMRWWVSLWAVAGLTMLVASAVVPTWRPWLSARASEHYRAAAAATEGADLDDYRARAERQVEATLEFLPKQLVTTGASLLGLAALSRLVRRGERGRLASRWGLTGFALAELFSFGFGMNPAIPAVADRPETAVVRALRTTVRPTERLLGLGQEWPPNLAMRYGLADVRNYDSMELARALDWLEPLYQPGGTSRSSRRTVDWPGVARARQRLEAAGVAAVVAASPPPTALGLDARRVGHAWIARLSPQPRAARLSTGAALAGSFDHGDIRIEADFEADDRIVVRETYDPGWRAEIDGRPAAVSPHQETFLSVAVPAGSRRIRLVYDPPEVRFALGLSLAALAACLAGLTASARRPTEVGSNSRSRAWNVPSHRVRIDSVTSSGTSETRNDTEG